MHLDGTVVILPNQRRESKIGVSNTDLRTATESFGEKAYRYCNRGDTYNNTGTHQLKGVFLQ